MQTPPLISHELSLGRPFADWSFPVTKASTTEMEKRMNEGGAKPDISTAPSTLRAIVLDRHNTQRDARLFPACPTHRALLTRGSPAYIYIRSGPRADLSSCG